MIFLLVGGAAIVLYLLTREGVTAESQEIPSNEFNPLGVNPVASTTFQQEQVKKFAAISAIAGASTASLLGAFATTASAAGPVGAVVAAAVLAIGMLRGTAHLVANEWVQRVQNPFGAALKAIVDEKDRTIREGSATSRSVWYARQAVSTLWNRYQTEAERFRLLSHDHGIVIDQSYETLDYRIKPDGTKVGSGLMTRILADMQNQIAELP